MKKLFEESEKAIPPEFLCVICGMSTCAYMHPVTYVSLPSQCLDRDPLQVKQLQTIPTLLTLIENKTTYYKIIIFKLIHYIVDCST